MNDKPNDSGSSVMAVANDPLLAVLRSRIAECEKEEQRLGKLLSAKRSEREKIQHEAVKAEFGVVIGSVVTGRDGLAYRVTSICPIWKTPWLKGNPRKKDGTWGNAERNLYGDWKASPANAKCDGTAGDGTTDHGK